MARLPRTERIRRRSDFQEVYERGTRVQGRYATLFVFRRGLDVGRLGVAATKKLGGAVQRNRAKRLIREVFRRNKPAPGFDVGDRLLPGKRLLTSDCPAGRASALGTEYPVAARQVLGQG